MSSPLLREIQATKIRLFGEEDDESLLGDEASGSDNSDQSYEIESPAKTLLHVRSQLRCFKNAYKSQLMCTMSVVRKLRTVHRENKRMQATVSMLEEQLRLAKLMLNTKKAKQEASTQTISFHQQDTESSPKLLENAYTKKEMSSPRSPDLSDIEDRIQEATAYYGLQMSAEEPNHVGNAKSSLGHTNNN